jgi:hypothetical protein
LPSMSAHACAVALYCCLRADRMVARFI